MNFFILHSNLNASSSTSSLIPVRPTVVALNIQNYLRKQRILKYSLHDIRQKFQDIRVNSKVPAYAVEATEYLNIFTPLFISNLLRYSFQQSIVSLFAFF